MNTSPATLHNKVAVVTGGTQGLGAAIALLLAQRGAAGVVICGRQVDKGHAQAQTDIGEHRGGGNGAKEAHAPFDPPESVEGIGMADPTERNSSEKDGSAPLEWDNDPHAGSSLSLCKHPLSGNGRQLRR